MVVPPWWGGVTDYRSLHPCGYPLSVDAVEMLAADDPGHEAVEFVAAQKTHPRALPSASVSTSSTSVETRSTDMAVTSSQTAGSRG